MYSSILLWIQAAWLKEEEKNNHMQRYKKSFYCRSCYFYALLLRLCAIYNQISSSRIPNGFYTFYSWTVYLYCFLYSLIFLLFCRKLFWKPLEVFWKWNESVATVSIFEKYIKLKEITKTENTSYSNGTRMNEHYFIGFLEKSNWNARARACR